MLLRCVEPEPAGRPTAREVADAFGALLAGGVEWEDVEGGAGGDDDSPAVEPETASDEEDDHEQWMRTIRTPLPEPLRIALVGVKDGVGCTTTTMVLGAALADQRQERVLAIDADRHTGSQVRIGGRVFRNTLASLSDLAESLHEVRHFEDLQLFLSPHRSGLQVLARQRLRLAHRVGRPVHGLRLPPGDPHHPGVLRPFRTWSARPSSSSTTAAPPPVGRSTPPVSGA